MCAVWTALQVIHLLIFLNSLIYSAFLIKKCVLVFCFLVSCELSIYLISECCAVFSSPSCRLLIDNHHQHPKFYILRGFLSFQLAGMGVFAIRQTPQIIYVRNLFSLWVPLHYKHCSKSHLMRAKNMMLLSALCTKLLTCFRRKTIFFIFLRLPKYCLLLWYLYWFILFDWKNKNTRVFCVTIIFVIVLFEIIYTIWLLSS